MKIGPIHVFKEQNSILFTDKGESLRMFYENLIEMLFVLRGMSEHEDNGLYSFSHVCEPKAGYVLSFGKIKEFITIKEAFLLMLALEGAIKNAL